MAPFLDKWACHMRNYMWKPKLPNVDSVFWSVDGQIGRPFLLTSFQFWNSLVNTS
jgi:hypothetical protein